MATNIGNPDPPIVGLSRPVGDPPTNISLGQVDDTVRVGTLTFTKGAGIVTPGSTSLTFNNNAGTAGNVVIADAGTVTLSGVTPSLVFSLPNGASQTLTYTTELITLSTSTTVTTSTTNLLPANALIDAVLTNCAVAIATATSYKVGDPTSDARFLSFTTSIGLNQASLGVNQWNPALATTLALSAIQSTATTIKITTAAATPPTAGKIRVTVIARTFAGPTS